ncbi:dihydrofolate reductase family protein [Prauserella oleivorans]|uniref:Dihydrofolate reductase family protein n=1 Tax=Prauserella oleivorans TaxID=1478153 RepID=A0ABW5WIC4_9PSEU
MLYSFIATSADGYHEAPGRNLDWHNVDDEFTEFSLDQLDHTGAIVFGRVTYEGMAQFWQSPTAWETDPETTRRMNALPKAVVTRTLTSADWPDTRVLDDPAKVGPLRDDVAGTGKDVAVFGSSTLAARLVELGVVDEIRLLVMPVLLGEGTPVYRGIGRSRLELVATRPFASGNVLHTYRPGR